MESKLIYLAGRIESGPLDEYRSKVSAARSILEDRFPDAKVYDPLDEDGLVFDQVVFTRVDLIVFLPGWTESGRAWRVWEIAVDADIDRVDLETLIDQPVVWKEIDCD